MSLKPKTTWDYVALWLLAVFMVAGVAFQNAGMILSGICMGATYIALS